MRLFCDFYTLWVEFVKSRCIKGPSPSVVTGNVYNDFQFLRNNILDSSDTDDDDNKAQILQFMNEFGKLFIIICAKTKVYLCRTH